jgi:FKBP-type peptidyl-prolyl cis-trans isomerase
MTFKRKLFSGGAGAVLLLAGCNDATGPDDDCRTLSNTLQEQRGDTVVTTTGVRYIDTTTGTGGTVASCRFASVSFRGTLLDGTEFQSTVPAYTIRPGSGALIPGFEQGVVGMRVGGVRRVIIPPNLAYGSTPRTDATGRVVIPANSTIVFDIGARAVE